MIIKELNHKPELSIKDATVELSYDEIRDIANGFTYLVHSKQFNDNVKELDLWDDFKPSSQEMEWFKERHKTFQILFDLVKNGTITDFTLEKFAPKTCPADCKGNTKD